MSAKNVTTLINESPTCLGMKKTGMTVVFGLVLVVLVGLSSATLNETGSVGLSISKTNQTEHYVR